MVVSQDSLNVLEGMRTGVQKQGDIVRSLKTGNASEMEIKTAVDELKARKKLLEAKELEIMATHTSFDRAKLEDLLKQRFFYDQSFSIYGGIQGLYDYGPMGCAMKANLLAAWRQHFVLEDQLLEVDCSMLTPYAVLEASGHVDRFTDLMVRDVKTGECFRADHLIKASLEAKENNKNTTETEKQEIRQILLQLDNFGKEDLDSIIRRFGIKAPTTNNDVTEPQEFNLMFATMIGPTGQCKGFLRPETAQGIFVNFQRLLHFNQGRIPFGAAQIGSAFRNEISPRSGLIRVREFSMAEIEYFVDPTDKRHPKFDHVRDVQMNFYSACTQVDGLPPRRLSIGEAVDQGIVANETLGYFMARIHLFLLLVGVDENRLRFRQHLSNEMAHYASDCWDAECQTSYGWIECVGCADRSCYDLTQHTKATGARLVAEKRLPEPRIVQTCKCVPNKQALGRAFRGGSKTVLDHLASLSLNDAVLLKEQLAQRGEVEFLINEKPFLITSSMVDFKENETHLHVEEFVPNVIEPSFGIGRILYTIFEHSFRVREGDEQRTFLSVSSVLAPFKCSILPLSNQPEFQPFIKQLSSALTLRGVSHRVDESSGSIGRRYARTDQIAIPYGITIDFDTINKSPATATLRERDSMHQIRVPLDELPPLVSNLSNCILSWADAQIKYPVFEQQETARADTSPSMLSEPHESPAKVKQMKDKNDLASPLHMAHQPNAVKGSTVEAIGITDEWQSVSEDLDEANRKLDLEVDDWSSATETADAHTGLLDVCEPQVPGDAEITESLMDRDNLCEPCLDVDNKLSWREFDPDNEGSAEKVVVSPVSGPPLVSIGVAMESDELRSSFSGYEADQEDNVASRSLLGPLSPVNKESDTLYELSPIVQSTGADVKNERTKKTESPDAMCTANQLPSLHTSDLAHHGLFVGRGWPEEPPIKEKRDKVKDKVPKTTARHGIKSTDDEQKGKRLGKTTNLRASTNDDWPAVLARMSKQFCIPELCQFQLGSEMFDSKLLFQKKDTAEHSEHHSTRKHTLTNETDAGKAELIPLQQHPIEKSSDSHHHETSEELGLETKADPNAAQMVHDVTSESVEIKAVEPDYPHGDQSAEKCDAQSLLSMESILHTTETGFARITADEWVPSFTHFSEKPTVLDTDQKHMEISFDELMKDPNYDINPFDPVELTHVYPSHMDQPCHKPFDGREFWDPECPAFQKLSIPHLAPQVEEIQFPHSVEDHVEESEELKDNEHFAPSTNDMDLSQPALTACVDEIDLLQTFTGVSETTKNELGEQAQREPTLARWSDTTMSFTGDQPVSIQSHPCWKQTERSQLIGFDMTKLPDVPITSPLPEFTNEHLTDHTETKVMFQQDTAHDSQPKEEPEVVPVEPTAELVAVGGSGEKANAASFKRTKSKRRRQKKKK